MTCSQSFPFLNLVNKHGIKNLPVSEKVKEVSDK